MLKGSVYIIARQENGDIQSPKNALIANRTQKIPKTIALNKEERDNDVKNNNSNDEQNSPFNSKYINFSFKKAAELSHKIMRHDSMSSPKSSLRKKSGKFDFESPSPRKSDNYWRMSDDSILSKEILLKLFPAHKLLNTLFAPNYFGEVALDEATTRYDF